MSSFRTRRAHSRSLLPQRAVTPYRGPADEAERATRAGDSCRHKGLAHSTIGLIEDPDDFQARRDRKSGIRALLINHFYVRLGLQPPADASRPPTRLIMRDAAA